MKLVHPDMENALFSPEQHMGFLAIENPQTLYEFSREFLSQIDDDGGLFCLSENANELAIPKVMAVIDSPLQLEHNPRRAITALYKQLEKHCVEEAAMDEMQEFLDALSLRLKRLLPELDVELEEIETPSWQAVFKFFDLKFKSSYTNLEEALLDYIRMTRTYLKMQFFVIIGAVQFLTKEGLENLNKQAVYEELRMLFVDGCLCEEKQPKQTRALIIDSDLCEIIRYNRGESTTDQPEDMGL